MIKESNLHTVVQYEFEVSNVEKKFKLNFSWPFDPFETYFDKIGRKIILKNWPEKYFEKLAREIFEKFGQEHILKKLARKYFGKFGIFYKNFGIFQKVWNILEILKYSRNFEVS